MRVERLRGDDPEAAAAQIRSLVPAAASVRDEVVPIVEAVRSGGDAELARLARRFDGVDEGLDVIAHSAPSGRERTQLVRGRDPFNPHAAAPPPSRSPAP